MPYKSKKPIPEPNLRDEIDKYIGKVDAVMHKVSLLMDENFELSKALSDRDALISEFKTKIIKLQDDAERLRNKSN